MFKYNKKYVLLLYYYYYYHFIFLIFKDKVEKKEREKAPTYRFPHN